MVMLIDNINFLKMNYPSLYQQMKEIEENIDETFVQLEATRNGEKTLKIQNDGKGIYLHSRYDPIKEANTLLEQYENTDAIDGNVHVIFYGIGLGYHVNLFLQKYNNVSFSIYEPVDQILYHYLANQNLQQLPLKNMRQMLVGDKEESTMKFLEEVVGNRDKEVIIFPLPSYQKNFSENYEAFLTMFKKFVKDERSSWGTNYTFQRRWILNSMVNLKEVLRTPNILLNKKEQFKDKPAILVAAGPSLDEEIENLRYIKDKGLAYIFTVGSAINTLVHHNIYPHAACTYDPSKANQKVFEKVVAKGIVDIPLIFGSSVGFETLENYPGKKIHMITSQDATAAYYLKAKFSEEIEGVMDAPSIAVITLQLLYKLGFEKVILLGQNLAYRDNKDYAEGIDYHAGRINEANLKSATKVKDVYGNEILTNDNFNRMRQQIEMYIKQFKGVEVINATAGGAHIEGTRFIDLKTIIEKDLQKPVVERDWLLMDSNNYDMQYMKQQMEKMNTAYKNVDNLIKKIREILNKIKRLCQNRNFKQVEKMYNKLDEVFETIKRNDYFNTFIMPRNRVFYKILQDEVVSTQSEGNQMKKAEKLINAFGKFIFTCEKDIKIIDKFFKQMHKEAEAYMKDNECDNKEQIDSKKQELFNIDQDPKQKEKAIQEEKKEWLPNDLKESENTKNEETNRMFIENLFVRKEDTLKYTMETIDRTAKGIALVTDYEGKLEGTVTDGDIRRAILKGSSLEDTVENIMKKNFIFVGENYSSKFIENIFRQKSIFQIPVLDEEMKVVDIIFYQDFIKKPVRENWAVIMAGGEGKRLMPLTADIPKPMLSVGSKPILEIIIEQLKDYGYNNILLCLNYKSDIIENYFQDGKAFDVNIEYIKEEKSLGTAGAIRLAKSHLNQSFLVINGDILTKLNFEEFMNYHQKHKNKITIATRRYELQIPYGVLKIDNETVVSLKEKPSSSMFINGGIYCLEPEIVEDIPENEYFDITQLIQKIIDREEKIGSFPIAEYWMDIGQVEDYHQANTDYQTLFRREACASKE
ncbi:sugar phosphate nucleotidyltransferase [Clostridium formicaceticum]|uniref:D-glycero-alpha-D-manno-heptose 1-phosphate guanylyltransferase n=1 Tax=Clostridium formicaceticum TaxID=1497 RepID=A0AAC9RH58_9CLOT|nr:sugar phosphate nucleotidyltransferase [Clostridium formicaceticum]AOY75647.1 hypothetical protein BJL90_06915 [Clostridium formicaceticum]ARE85961.1 D-glycero-alpha-D-manno-heptose 1-phosphate guanylyltransferase [Clostridium formicaceticum]